MQLSPVLTSITPGGDDGWEIFRKARQRRAAGEPILELTIGEHDIRTHPSILTAMDDSARGGHTGYAALSGTLALRTAIARRVTQRTGVKTGPQNVLITPGGQA
ncbi:MAG: pyridoxal phosphate-dependent aminotransferase, partial [Shimia sp.]